MWRWDRDHPLGVARDAALITLVAIGLSLGVNGLRAEGIPLVRHLPYAVLVPCPRPGGEVQTVAAEHAWLRDPATLVVDAREPEAFAQWHKPGALSVPYDFLDPTSEADIERVSEVSAQQIVVYGDGQDPDSGCELARDLAVHDIKRVYCVAGGAPALRPILEGERP